MSQRKWEYASGSFTGSSPSVDALNRMGRDGWELIDVSPANVTRAHDVAYGSRVICLFKREAVEQQPTTLPPDGL